MSCLESTFTLTPRSPFYFNAARDHAVLFCYGADFAYVNPTDFESLHATNRFFFDAAYAADATLDYSLWANRQKTRHLVCYLDLRDYSAAHKQLALLFAFDVLYSNAEGRVQAYTDAGLLHEQTLVFGDGQFLLEIETLDLPLTMYFIHAGGYWFFRGLSGYVV